MQKKKIIKANSATNATCTQYFQLRTIHDVDLVQNEKVARAVSHLSTFNVAISFFCTPFLHSSLSEIKQTASLIYLIC